MALESVRIAAPPAYEGSIRTLGSLKKGCLSMKDDTGKAESSQVPGIIREVISLVAIFFFTLTITFTVEVFAAEPFVIPSGSMEATLNVGDRIVGEKLSLRLGPPRAGDIVTFADPEDPSQTLIKRVVASCGQTVSLEGGQVVVVGVALDEPYAAGLPSEPIGGHGSNLGGPVSYPYEVPEGYLWVMGDNRTNSLDSRYFGAVPVSSVTSRAVFRFWPLDEVGAI